MKTTEFQTLDERIAAMMKAAGGAMYNAEIAKQLGMEPGQTITVVKRLVRQGALRHDNLHTHQRYIAAEFAAPIPDLPAPTVFKEYKLPKAMMDLMTRVQVERESIRSYFGEPA